MTRTSILIFCFLFLSKPIYAQDRITTPPLIEPSVTYFSLADVQLLDGYLKDMQQRGKEYLLYLDPDKLLYYYRIEAGLLPKASEPYWGWERSLRGGALGHYIFGLSMMYEATSDPQIFEKLCYILNELDTCKKVVNDGYILAIEDGRTLFNQIASGDIRVTNGHTNGYWVPVAMITKLSIGLYDAYQRCGLDIALQLLTGLTTWFGTQVLDKLSDSQLQTLLITEPGSIHEAYLFTYSVTGEVKYLNWAERLNEDAWWMPLYQNIDILPSEHANSQIPKFTGFFKYYTYSGDNRFATAAHNFWNIVLNDHTWVIGGNSSAEHFFTKSEFPYKVLDISGPETCNTVNMLRLCEALFQYDPDSKYADYYERALFNHIQSAYDPLKGMCCYHTPMRPGHYRVYASTDSSFWCCSNQTGVESPVKLAAFIYSKKNNDLMINLFVNSELQWNDAGLTLEQQSALPDSGGIALTLNFDQPKSFKLLIRKPCWADTAVFRINDEIVNPETDEKGYWTIEKTWLTENEIRINIPLRIRAEGLIGSNEYVALTYGPYVLAGRLGKEQLPTNFWPTDDPFARNQIPVENVPSFSIPIDSISKHVIRITNDTLRFRIMLNGFPTNLVLEPFFRIHFERYAIYWRIVPDISVATHSATEINAEQVTLNGSISGSYPYLEKGFKWKQSGESLWEKKQ